MKKIGQLDNDLDKVQEELSAANAKLEEGSKKAADVSLILFFFCYCYFVCLGFYHL
jgi:hypothetical protein